MVKMMSCVRRDYYPTAMYFIVEAFEDDRGFARLEDGRWVASVIDELMFHDQVGGITALSPPLTLASAAYRPFTELLGGTC